MKSTQLLDAMAYAFFKRIPRKLLPGSIYVREGPGAHQGLLLQVIESINAIDFKHREQGTIEAEDRRDKARLERLRLCLTAFYAAVISIPQDLTNEYIAHIGFFRGMESSILSQRCAEFMFLHQMGLDALSEVFGVREVGINVVLRCTPEKTGVTRYTYATGTSQTPSVAKHDLFDEILTIL